jgi:hypothetical protein
LTSRSNSNPLKLLQFENSCQIDPDNLGSNLAFKGSPSESFNGDIFGGER